jgi:hypothetical protein
MALRVEYSDDDVADIFRATLRGTLHELIEALPDGALISVSLVVHNMFAAWEQRTLESTYSTFSDE